MPTPANANVSTLADAIHLSVEAHRFQKDRAGEPYYLHPLRVMLKMESEAEMMVAVLHDLLEDTANTPEMLRSWGYPEIVISALDLLTRRKGEKYDDFVARLAPSPLARKVKIADIEDNLNLARLDNVTSKDVPRLARYVRSWHLLKSME